MMKKDDENQTCKHTVRFNSQKLLEIYPFNKASFIKLVSFETAQSDVVLQPSKEEYFLDTTQISQKLKMA